MFVPSQLRRLAGMKGSISEFELGVLRARVDGEVKLPRTAEVKFPSFAAQPTGA
jgi:hypothetical protein